MKPKNKISTHTGIIKGVIEYHVKLRQTSTMWVDETGVQYRKKDGSVVQKPYINYKLKMRLILSTIKKIEGDKL